MCSSAWDGRSRRWSPRPEVVVPEFDRALQEAALDDPDLEISSGAEAMMNLHPIAWATKWVDWIWFLFDAREHGGIVVG